MSGRNASPFWPLTGLCVAVHPQTRAAKRTIVQNGKYLGEACGDMKPGEAMTADGTKTTVQ